MRLCATKEEGKKEKSININIFLKERREKEPSLKSFPWKEKWVFTTSKLYMSYLNGKRREKGGTVLFP